MLTDASSFLPPGAVAHRVPGRGDRRSARSGSTCSATGCASRSIRGCGDDGRAPRPATARGADQASCCRSRISSSGSGPTTGPSTPSTASRFDLEPGETPRARRRVRAAARASPTSPSSACCPQPAGRIEGGARHVRRAGPGHAPRARAPRHPRPRHRDDLPGPDDQPQPRPHHRGADGRDDPGPPEDRSKADARDAGDRAARHGRHPAAREAPQELPAPVLRRDAPARDDRDGARPRAAS